MRTVAFLNLDHLQHNLQVITSLSQGRDVMAIVKANAYGHGDLLIVRALADLQVNKFAVASVEEGCRIRKEFPQAYVLVIGAVDPKEIKEAQQGDIAVTLHNKECIEKALREPGKGKFHLQIDTGMHRSGLSLQECKELLPYIKQLEPEGIYTHLATSEERRKDFAKKQILAFEEVLRFFQKEQVRFSMIHYANSGACLYHDLGISTMVRPGIALYGIDPREEGTFEERLQPVLEVKSTVVALRTIEKGESVGYGRKYTANSTNTIATVAIGYADGYFRSLSGRGKVWINGSLCPLVGSVTMDYVMVDVTGVKVGIGDEVEILGSHISATQLAKWAQTIPYEICTSLSQRVKRCYKERG